MDAGSGQGRTARQILQQHGLLVEWRLLDSSPDTFPKFVAYEGSYAHRIRDDGRPGPSVDREGWDPQPAVLAGVGESEVLDPDAGR